MPLSYGHNWGRERNILSTLFLGLNIRQLCCTIKDKMVFFAPIIFLGEERELRGVKFLAGEVRKWESTPPPSLLLLEFLRLL